MLLYVPLVVLLRKYESGYSERGYVQTAGVQSRVVRTVHDVDDCLIVPVQVLHPMQTTVHACTADLFGLGVTDTVSVTVCTWRGCMSTVRILKRGLEPLLMKILTETTRASPASESW